MEKRGNGIIVNFSSYWGNRPPQKLALQYAKMGSRRADTLPCTGITAGTSGGSLQPGNYQHGYASLCFGDDASHMKSSKLQACS